MDVLFFTDQVVGLNSFILASSALSFSSAVTVCGFEVKPFGNKTFCSVLCW